MKHDTFADKYHVSCIRRFYVKGIMHKQGAGNAVNFTATKNEQIYV